MRSTWPWSVLALLIAAIACGRLGFESMPRSDASAQCGPGSACASDARTDASADSAAARMMCSQATDCSTVRCGCGLCDPQHDDCCTQATDCATVRCGCNKCDPAYGECCTQATDCATLRCGCSKCDPKPGDCCTNAVDCASLRCIGGICQ